MAMKKTTSSRARSTGVRRTGGVVRIKRVYAPAEAADGYRVLVDRLWPRAIKKEELGADAWMKELAPSTELRRWFGHDPARFEAFAERYRAELGSDEAQAKLRELAERAAESTVTLLFAAHDEEHNNAVVLREVIDAIRARRGRRSRAAA